MKPQRAIVVTLLLALTLNVSTWGQPAPSMTAHFINIGQGESVLLEFPCGAMLIDAGAQDEAAKARLVGYLNTFFGRRTDLHRTLNTILLTHDHIDHDAALRAVVENFTVEHFVDNGLLTGPGAPNPKWLRKEVADHHRSIDVEEVTESEVDGVVDKIGFTNDAIDPIHCDTVDPEIHVLRGRIAPNPGWSDDDFGNLNNHSLVTRVDFNGASLLFLGDLEEPGIEGLLKFYSESAAKALDVDVLQVGHHGSNNATTKALLDATSPRIAVINVGRWNWGAPNKPFTTFTYGHPRQVTLDLLNSGVSGNRAHPISVMAAASAKHFHQTTVRKAIYATGWDGTVRVVVKGKDDFTVFRER